MPTTPGPTHIDALVAEHLSAADRSDLGRSAGIVVHDGELRQTILALTAGTRLGEHNSPHAASLYVLQGRVVVTAPSGDVTVEEGEIVTLTHERHAVEAVVRSAILLTTVTGVPDPS